MGKKSIKENKSIYQISREANNLTRENVEDLMLGLTASRIEKIENGKTMIHPEDVILMSKCYKKPGLCNYYCSNECPIGIKKIPDVELKELGQITIETLNALNKLNKEKDRLLEIAEDGTVGPEETTDFLVIKSTLDKISLSVQALQLWIDEAIANGKLPNNFITSSTK